MSGSRIEIEGWVRDCSLKHTQGIQDDQAKRMLNEIEVAVTSESKGNIDRTHSKENRGPWPRKTTGCFSISLENKPY